MPRSDSDDDYHKKKKKKSKGKHRDKDKEKRRSKEHERDRSREKERDRSRDRDGSRERDSSRDRGKDYERKRDRKHKEKKEKKHKDRKSEKKSKLSKSDVADLTPAEKFNMFKKQREAGKTEDSVVDDMFKDFIAAKLKEIETDASGIPENDNDSKAADIASSVEEMNKYLDSELNNMSPAVKQEPKLELSILEQDADINNMRPVINQEAKLEPLTEKQDKDLSNMAFVIEQEPRVESLTQQKQNAKDINIDRDNQSKEKNSHIKENKQCDTKLKAKPDFQTTFVTTVTPTNTVPVPPITAPKMSGPISLKQGKDDENDEGSFPKLAPLNPFKVETKKADDNKKSILGFKNFGIKLSLTSTELIQSGAVHKNGKRLEDGEVMSSSNSEDNMSPPREPEVAVDDDTDVNEDVSETGSINDTDDEAKTRRRDKKKKAKHKKKKKSKSKEEKSVFDGSGKLGEKRKVSHGSRSRSRSPKKSRQSKERSNRSRSKDRSERSRSKDRKRSKRISKDKSNRSSSRDGSKRSRSRSRSRKRHSRSLSRGRRSTSRTRRRSKDRSPRKHRSRSKSREGNRARSPVIPWRSSRYGDFDAFRYSSRRPRSRTPERESEKFKEKERKRLDDLRNKIDKAKLREIAIKNAVSAARTGGVPLDVTIKAGGKSVEELTQYCKRIQDAEKAKRLARGEEVSSEEEIDLKPDDDEDEIHHPFTMKEPSAITMNIQNAKQLAIISPQERLAQTGTLRLQFPVSSGSNHREKEWEPVVPDPAPKPGLGAGSQLAIPQEQDKVFEEPTPVNVDISSIVSERLTAVRKLQENPNDVIAQQILNQAQQKASQWANSRNLPGQFVGSTGASVMSAEELMGNKKRQAWIKKDVFTSAAPVTSGIGMFLLQKMGWKMGEGLGKYNTGQKEPLMLDFKVDRKGLVTSGEGKKPAHVPKVVVKDLSGKHPVSALGEFCNRRKWSAPRYEMIHESGPSHKKDFVFKVMVNGNWYQPSTSSNNKKLAKAAAATVCLQELGMIPRDGT